MVDGCIEWGFLSMHSSSGRSKLFALALISSLLALPVYAEEPNPTIPVTAQSNPEQFDRDGKHICGFNLMNDSERGGYRSMMHATKDPAFRDEIRVEHCKNMRKRAEERGVKLDE
jgi:hypothetical protein